MRKYILLGAGQRARSVIELLPYGSVLEVMDSDKKKIGSSFIGLIIKETDLNYICTHKHEYDVIITFNDSEIIDQCKMLNISYYVCWGRNEKNIFMNNEIQRLIIETLYNMYLYDQRIKRCLYKEPYENFRYQPKSDLNRLLIDEMKLRNTENVSKILNELYSEINTMFDDEYYDYRVGMQLSKRIIQEMSQNIHLDLLDIGCGNASFLKELSFFDNIGLNGIDVSKQRIDSNCNNNIHLSYGLAEQSNKSDESFDIVTCFECLEHVINPVAVISEIHRILRKKGLVIITVPYKTYCDCDTHVRFFTENSIYTLLNSHFEIVNMLNIPYVWGDSNNNIFVVAKRKELQ